MSDNLETGSEQAQEPITVTDVNSQAAAIEARMLAAETSQPEETGAEPTSEDQEAETQEAEEAKFETIEQVAEAAGMDVDEFLSTIKVKAKVNGEEQELTLAEQRAGYQREADYTRKTMEVAEARKALQAEQESARADLQTRVQTVGNMVTSIENQLVNDFQSVNWQQLRVEDPVEYANLRQDFQDRQSYIANLKSQAISEVQRLQKEAKAAHENAIKDYVTKQEELTLSKIPDWKDPEVRAKEESEISAFIAKNYGFTKEDAGIFNDHRMRLLARDAYRRRDVDTKAEIAQKKVANIPKMLKPGAKQSVKQQHNAEIKAKRDKLKSSGKVSDFAAALESRMR